ncbi:hypothetical protein COV93_04670 [Candidatus Woesearchaeota archaeon CG11_big_fil_rev_8_21_14_0_20_43_8]|nr:MAG: hypothetical protein COV93_04670 [Candidatus Woesearchaeota archaeon CG11_big_fil_rev_8_21_14_0_20_43_8]PIO06829.1 MAG: hypothetical protein COT47_02555 [Candidatus Woesearchaeota archaeon CG08_land_8_20_14_0_20_43_7]
MKIEKLKPDQIITLNDFPVHSMSFLENYVLLYKSKKKIAYVPVVHRDIVLKHLDGRLNDIYEGFQREHPNAEYFMLDGSHRTTAAALTRNNIEAVVFETDEDIKEAKIEKISENPILDRSLEENCKILNAHFEKNSHYETVLEKADRMRAVTPEYIITLAEF